MHYVIKTFVEEAEERFRNVHAHGVGPNAVFMSESLGWYITFTNSYESLCVGKEKPFLERGDAVNIIIEKAE